MNEINIVLFSQQERPEFDLG